MKTIEQLIKDGTLGSHPQKICENFHQGTIGVGHTEKDPDKVKPQDKNALSTAGGAGKEREPSVLEEPPQKKAPTGNEKENHKPMSVIGPKGKKRGLIRSDSLGLQFSHDIMPGQDELWKIDMTRGIIHFNIRHPLWVKCDKDDRTILRLQEYITVQALMLCEVPEEWRDHFDIYIHDAIRSFVYLITKSASFATQAQLKKLSVVKAA